MVMECRFDSWLLEGSYSHKGIRSKIARLHVQIIDAAASIICTCSQSSGDWHHVAGASGSCSSCQGWSSERSEQNRQFLLNPRRIGKGVADFLA